MLSSGFRLFFWIIPKEMNGDPHGRFGNHQKPPEEESGAELGREIASRLVQ
jgi:hypothetical protein